ncbi:hypothetical protein I8752_29150 [Nostocaceae cyanobacterium CENA369]|uniref:Uncharacterized protein n=1 Tax=Dendronalium phyllosphericum CENA369 TaxID=1725256 RepID=A0A8J7LIS6_9NOST|nr:hypothetical protein [Dendronalium phyllosphericum]MBH8576979.1 hypothetical protein [Dendronalium phyllosphericum CENA369]
MTQQLLSKIEELYVKSVLRRYTPLELAQTLEAMANQAWDEVDDFLAITHDETQQGEYPRL